MNKLVLSLVKISLMSALVACSGSPSSSSSPAQGEDDGTTEADLSTGTFTCTPAKATKHPTFAGGLSLTLGAAGASIEAEGSTTRIPLTKAPAAASKKFKDFDRYEATIGSEHVLVLLKALANGEEALHLSRPFASEDYVCSEGAEAGDGGKAKGDAGAKAKPKKPKGKAKRKLRELEICDFAGETIGDCASDDCAPSADDDDSASRCGP